VRLNLHAEELEYLASEMDKICSRPKFSVPSFIARVSLISTVNTNRWTVAQRTECDLFLKEDTQIYAPEIQLMIAFTSPCCNTL
jgi:hypothetical protein